MDRAHRLRRLRDPARLRARRLCRRDPVRGGVLSAGSAAAAGERVSVIGLGPLGLVHAAALASLGHRVIGVERDPGRVAALRAGECPVHEPGLGALLRAGLGSGRLRVTTDLAAARGSAAHFLAVGTPAAADGSHELGGLFAAFRQLLPVLGPGELVVGKSTVPPGTAARLAAELDAAGVGADLAWNPEFLSEGRAVADALRPARLLYGVRGPAATARLDAIYREQLAAGTPRAVTDLATAELTKLATNAFLATKLSFINALAPLATAAGADPAELARLLGGDPRIGAAHLGPGLGFGGGCLPKDTRGLAAVARATGLAEGAALLDAVSAVNEGRRWRLAAAAWAALGRQDPPGEREPEHPEHPEYPRQHSQHSQPRVTILGCSFKPETDDTRVSPGLEVAASLAGGGAAVTVTDPAARPGPDRLPAGVRFEPETAAALAHAELVILATEWPQYRELDPRLAAALVARPRMIDARWCLPAARWRSAGWALLPPH